jgi:hypothetical protein
MPADTNAHAMIPGAENAKRMAWSVIWAEVLPPRDHATPNTSAVVAANPRTTAAT